MALAERRELFSFNSLQTYLIPASEIVNMDLLPAVRPRFSQRYRPKRCFCLASWGGTCLSQLMITLAPPALHNRERNRWTVDLLNIQSGDRIVEIGCGPGLALEGCLVRVGDG